MRGIPVPSSMSAAPPRRSWIFIFIIILSIWPREGAAQIGAAIGKASLAGTWRNDEAGLSLVLLLQPDGTGSFNGGALRYSQTGSQLTLSMAGSQPVTYNYVLLGDVLSLSGGDLGRSLAFARQPAIGSPAAGAGGSAAPSAPSAPSPSEAILGIWEGYGETMEFRAGGVVVYLGRPMSYAIAGDSLTLSSGGQTLSMGYRLSGDQLTLSANGKQLVYSRRGATASASAEVSKGAAPGGIIAPELVGTWASIDVTSTNTGGVSSSVYIVLKQDGTYEYRSEGSISVNTPDLRGGTASQAGDVGTWRLEGNVLHVQSRTYGAIDYRFEKRNHPKTGDPMIVIDGQTYVTYYQRAPWR